VKSVNDDEFSCTMFRDNLSPYIDEELTKETEAKLLAHAAECPSCGNLLKNFVSMKQWLGNLPQATVSGSFDVEMRRRIRLEAEQLNNPSYRFKLFIRDNMKVFLAVPAVAVLLFGMIFLPFEAHFKRNMEPETTQGRRPEPEADFTEMAEISQGEIVNYVLDSINQQELESGIFLNEYHMSRVSTASKTDVKLISF